MLFVDEVREMMPKTPMLDHIKHDIMEAAREGRREYAFTNSDLTGEIQWLKEQGFIVEVWTIKPYQDVIMVKW